jgi:hypothetical protein
MKLKIAPEYVDLHQQVMKQIEAEPERWNQGSYVSTRKMNEVGLDSARLLALEVVDLNECGTTACYAGWALHLTGFKVNLFNQVFNEDGERDGGVFDKAAEVLGLDHGQADEIFHYTSVRGKEVTVRQLKARVSRVTGIDFD